METQADLRVLGVLRVVSGVREIPVARGHQQVVLAALLLTPGKPVAVDVLYDALWGDRPPPRPERILQPSISRLRRFLAPLDVAITYSGGFYTLVAEEQRVDAARFEGLLSLGRHALREGQPDEAARLLGAALELWTGEPYADLDAPVFADERDRLAQQRLSAQTGLIAARLALGHGADLIAGAEALARRHPLNEQVAEQLIHVLLRSGRPAEAMFAYHRLRRDLAEELGQPPSPDLTELYGRMLAQETVPGRVWRLPPDNPKFCGRRALLAELHETLTRSGVVMLHGLAGIGKTQLALRYAHQHDGSVVWWCPADTDDLVDAAMVKLARELGIDATDDLDGTRAAVRRLLAERPGWLLVFDNAEQIRHLRGWLPPAGTGSVLITSRNPDGEGHARELAVPIFTRAESVSFLRQRAGADEDAATLLADRLGDLPLALEQASAFCARSGETFGSYLTFLDRGAADVLARGGTSDYDGTVAQTWRITFDRLAAQDPDPIRLLYACAFLAADDIPVRVLGAAVPGLADGLRLADAIGTAKRYSLIDRRPGTVTMHRLVQDLLRETPPVAERRETLARLAGALDADTPADPAAMQRWPDWETSLPHILALLGHIEADVPAWTPEFGALLCRTAAYLDERGAYAAAGRMLGAAISLIRRARPDDKLGAAEVLIELGRVLDHGGCDMYAARERLLEALSILEGVEQTSPRAIGRTLSRLAHALDCADLLAEARDTHHRALGLLVEAGDRLEWARAMVDLGYTEWKLHDLDAAGATFAVAIEVLTERLGRHHPEVANARSGLGMTLQYQGDLDGALVLVRTALDDLRAAHPGVGDLQPDIAQTLDKLGYTLMLSGDATGALDCHDRAVRALAMLFGEADPRVAMATTNRGLDEAMLGDMAAAEASQRRAWDIFTQAYGTKHSHTVLAAGRLAEVMAACGDP